MRRVTRSSISLRYLERSCLQSPQSETRCLVTGGSHRRFHTKNRDLSEALGTVAKLPNSEPIPAKHAKHSTSLSDILDRRAKAGKLVAGTAAYSDSDMFKAPVRVTYTGI